MLSRDFEFGFEDGENSEAYPKTTTVGSVLQATIITAIGIAIVISNILIIAAIKFKGDLLLIPGNQVFYYYLLSLAVADLLCGLLIVPLSVYPAITREWMYGDLMCRLAGYLEITLWCVSVYTFVWMSVDRYRAIRKPTRYVTGSATIQTRRRCLCWVVFTWISSAMVCSPPLLVYQYEAIFDNKTLICMLDLGSSYAYTVTIAILVLGPSIISTIYIYSYIFSMQRKLESGLLMHDKVYGSALSQNFDHQSHTMSLTLVTTFWLTWIPYAGLRFYEYYNGHEINIPGVHFLAVWTGIFNLFWKIFVVLSVSPQFRLAIRLLGRTVCCRSETRVNVEIVREVNDD